MRGNKCIQLVESEIYQLLIIYGYRKVIPAMGDGNDV